MVKFKSDVTFRGLEENKVFKAGKEFEMTIKRAEDAQKKLKDKYGIDANFERVDDKKEEEADKKEADEE